MLIKNRTAAMAIKQLHEKLGTAETVDMFVFALPIIIEREAELRESLLSGHLQKASQHAHKTISSIRLYGSAELEDLLKEVSNIQNHQHALELQPRLSAEFNSVIKTVENWLSKYNSK